MRKQNLRAFLEEHRARLKPEDVGLSRGESRRAAGLGREEVAALAGVSRAAYVQFEAGTHQRDFSFDFVQRVADALRLESRDRATMQRLALPGIAEATDQLERSIYDGAARFLTQIREFIKRSSSASSFEDAALLGVKIAQQILAPDCLTVYCPKDAGDDAAAYASGPRARHWGRLAQRRAYEVHATLPSASVAVCQNLPMPQGAGGTIVLTYERDERGRPSPYDRECAAVDWNEVNRARMRSGLAVALHEAGTYNGTLVIAFAEPGKVQPIDIEFLGTLGAIVDLTAGGSRLL